MEIIIRDVSKDVIKIADVSSLQILGKLALALTLIFNFLKYSISLLPPY